MSNATRSAALPAIPVRDALLVWVTSTTVASERRRLSTELNRARSVFGSYGESTRPGIARIASDLEELDRQPDNATLIPVPHSFGVTHASQLLPRGARVVGWLDDAGYRGVTDTPQPSTDWLESQAAHLR